MGSCRGLCTGRTTHGRRIAQHRSTHGERKTHHSRVFGLVDREDAIEIMCLDPALEETRRHRQTRTAVADLGEFKPREPARIDILAEFDAQPALHPGPDPGIGLPLGGDTGRNRCGLPGKGAAAALPFVSGKIPLSHGACWRLGPVNRARARASPLSLMVLRRRQSGGRAPVPILSAHQHALCLLRPTKKRALPRRKTVRKRRKMSCMTMPTRQTDCPMHRRDTLPNLWGNHEPSW